MNELKYEANLRALQSCCLSCFWFTYKRVNHPLVHVHAHCPIHSIALFLSSFFLFRIPLLEEGIYLVEFNLGFWVKGSLP